MEGKVEDACPPRDAVDIASPRKAMLPLLGISSYAAFREQDIVREKYFPHKIVD